MYDVVVAGAGMAGSTLALALVQKGLHVALIDKEVPRASWPKPAGVRVSALSVASESLLRRLGIWKLIESEYTTPYENMAIWEEKSPSHLTFNARNVHWTHLGHIVENAAICHAAIIQLKQIDSSAIKMPTAFISHESDSNQTLVVHLSNGEHLKTRLLVGADGAHSRVARYSSIRKWGWSYPQSALVARFATSSGHQSRAWQRFLAHGPLALLPWGEKDVSIVWTSRHDKINDLIQMSPAELNHAVRVASDGAVGDMQSHSARIAFPLHLRLAESMIGKRVALVGDAAHVIHPQAGQGVNLGLMDVAALVDALDVTHPSVPVDCGDPRRLEEFHRKRYAHNLMMVLGVDAVGRCYLLSPGWLRHLRHTGVGMIQKMSILKNMIASEAMGISALTPNLARPPSYPWLYDELFNPQGNHFADSILSRLDKDA